MNIRTVIIAACLMLATVATATASVAGSQPKLYKWVDKSGVVHYGTSIPPEYASQQQEVLNSEGITVQTLPGQKTPQQLAKEARDKAAAEEQARQLQQQRIHDQMLIDTYTSVADIERDRDSRLAAIDAQINVTNAAISGLQKTLADYQQRVAEMARIGKPIPASLQKQTDDTQQQLINYQKLLLKQVQTREDTRMQYTADIKRFQELTATQGKSQNGGG